MVNNSKHANLVPGSIKKMLRLLKKMEASAGRMALNVKVIDLKLQHHEFFS